MPPPSPLGSLATLCVALLALHGPALRAQRSAPASSTAHSDSLDVLRGARQAQRKFESIHRAYLPSELDEGGHRCDERIGRYCYWYQPGSRPPPPEASAVRAARERLLRTLSAAAGRLPGDGWIIGQTVRYLVDHGRLGSAVDLARRCRAARWWCEALEGFARHLASDYEAADQAFERALRDMSEVQRCAWLDLRPLLGEGERLYRGLPCAERSSADERIWWLARPLYSHPGNDLRTEHYARRTMALLLEGAETVDGLSGGDDTRELFLRFGWPRYWSRAVPLPGSMSPPPILGHEPSPSFWLFPLPALAEPWADVTKVRWDPETARPPARYAPRYTAGFAPIGRLQLARFRRGDSTLTVAAYDLSSDSILGRGRADARLAVARDPATPSAVVRVMPARPVGVLTVSSAWRPAVVSVEMLGIDTPWVARWRAMAPPDPGGLPPLVSDILLFAPADPLPPSLEAALPLALDAPVVRVGRRLGLYWELYDRFDQPTVALEISVSVMKARTESDESNPVGRPECPFRVESPVSLRWREEPGARAHGGARAVALDLRSLSKGRYIVTVQVSAAGLSGCSTRDLEVVGH